MTFGSTLSFIVCHPLRSKICFGLTCAHLWPVSRYQRKQCRILISIQCLCHTHYFARKFYPIAIEPGGNSVHCSAKSLVDSSIVYIYVSENSNWLSRNTNNFIKYTMLSVCFFFSEMQTHAFPSAAISTFNMHKPLTIIQHNISVFSKKRKKNRLVLDEKCRLSNQRFMNRIFKMKIK